MRKNAHLSTIKLGRLVSIALTFCLVAAMASVAAAAPLSGTKDTPWTGSGSGTTSVVSDGSTAPAEFNYNNPGVFSGAWQFETIAAAPGTHDMSWDYRGYHAFFNVRVGLDAFVDDGINPPTITNLVSAGPVSCCTAPSGGFAYVGSHTFVVNAGDTYGFMMTGSHSDSDRRLLGTLKIDENNTDPDCGSAAVSEAMLWPPNHKFVDITVDGVTDADGDTVTINIDSIFQDEETDALGDGAFSPDASGVGTDTAAVRAERSGTGDGRVYTIGYTADDGYGGACNGTLTVGVPHNKKATPIDGGALFDSTL